jgi:hypothetical protein
VPGVEMQNCYKLLKVKDVQRDEDSILEVLEAIKSHNLPNDLRLLNYYKEVPISFGATIDNIDRGVVEMTVHQLQAISILNQKMTFVKSKHFQHDVLAKVLKIRKEKNFVLLTQFAYVQILSERRKFVRVKIMEKLDATFRYDQKLLQGTLDDISIGGATIISPDKCGIENNAMGTVYLYLRGTKLEVPCKLLRGVESPDGNRYIVEFESDTKSERIISKFIFEIQSEIIRELKDQET